MTGVLIVVLYGVEIVALAAFVAWLAKSVRVLAQQQAKLWQRVVTLEQRRNVHVLDDDSGEHERLTRQVES